VEAEIVARFCGNEVPYEEVAVILKSNPNGTFMHIDMCSNTRLFEGPQGETLLKVCFRHVMFNYADHVLTINRGGDSQQIPIDAIYNIEITECATVAHTQYDQGLELTAVNERTQGLEIIAVSERARSITLRTQAQRIDLTRDYEHRCVACDSKLQYRHAWDKFEDDWAKTANEEAEYKGLEDKFKKLWKSGVMQFICCTCFTKANQYDHVRKTQLKELEQTILNMEKMGFSGILDLRLMYDQAKEELESGELPNWLDLYEKPEPKADRCSNAIPTSQPIIGNDEYLEFHNVRVPPIINPPPRRQETAVIGRRIVIDGGYCEDNDMTTAGDYLITVARMIGMMREIELEPPFYVQSNNNVYLHAQIGNNFDPIIGLTEMERIVSMNEIMAWQTLDEQIRGNIFGLVHHETNTVIQTRVLTLE
jgi:hypothetical protein